VADVRLKTKREKKMKKQKIFYVASLLLIVVGIAGFASAHPNLTKGRIPDEAFGKDGIRAELAPDFIPALDREGNEVGYVSKVDVFDEKAGDRKILVVDETLSRPIGHMVPGRGFVRFGVAEESVPKFETEVRSDSVKDKK
jgi:hypothetical protein